MKKLFLLFVVVCPGAILFAQDSTESDSESYADRRANEIETFVNDIVNRVETGLDNMMEKRSRGYNEEIATDKGKKDSSYDDAVTFNGDTEIAVNDTIQGDLVVKYGMLTIRGVVNGDVLVVNGMITIKNTGHVKGNVRSMNGSVTKDDGAIVDGYIEQSSESRTYKRKRTSRVKYSFSFKPTYWIDAPYVDDNFIFRYNRAEGFFVGAGSEKNFYWDGSRIISGFGSFGYGFAMHRWRMQLGLDRQFASGGDVLYEFGGEVHSVTDTKDEWRMKLSENTIASLLFREDFRDYYLREGFSAHTARYSKEGDLSTIIDFRYSNDRYNSLSNQTNWAIFIGGNKIFRPNPSVDEGMIRSVSMTAGISSVERFRNKTEGWNIFGRAEYAGKELGGDYDFNQAIIDIHRFQQISDEDQISIRIRAGSLEGTPVVQRLFELGGANTMPAYGFKEFAGNRMVLGNVEYQLQGEIMDGVFFWPNSLNLIFFGDAGAVVTASQRMAVYDGFDAINSSAIKSDLGFGIGWNDDGARLGFAWRTDKKAPVAVFLRLNRAF